jgi:DNA-binding transcriptional regulator YbjK
MATSSIMAALYRCRGWLGNRYRAGMDRREAITAGAIAVLANQGERGLTHRAVDRHLSLPMGSTSYYFRTRDALVAAVADRLVALDLADVAEVTDDVSGIEDLLDRWLLPANRDRLIARFELFLGSSRAPHDAPLASARRMFRSRLEAAVASAGAPDPSTAATGLMALIEGLLLDGVLGGDLNRDQRRDLLATVLTAVLDGDGGAGGLRATTPPTR